MVPLVYSRRYNITAFGLERRHPFDGCKYRRIHDWLIRQGLRQPSDFITPRPCARADLLRVHTPEYLRSLRDRRVLARILEVPVVGHLPAWLVAWRVLQPMRWATGGTVLACRLALEKGLAINLGGGFHHASPDRGGGFCAFADVPLALAALQQERFAPVLGGGFPRLGEGCPTLSTPLGPILIVDTDAHQGNGTADAIRSWPWAHLLDLYEEDLFPWPKAEEALPVPLPRGLCGAGYLDLLREHLPDALEHVDPKLIVYNAGSDVLEADPLAGLCLTVEEMCERDFYVVTQACARGVPLAMVLSGGYGPHSWEAHARSIEGILARFDGPA
jgi:histone deacetylase 11